MDSPVLLQSGREVYLQSDRASGVVTSNSMIGADCASAEASLTGQRTVMALTIIRPARRAMT